MADVIETRGQMKSNQNYKKRNVGMAFKWVNRGEEWYKIEVKEKYRNTNKHILLLHVFQNDVI